MTPVKDYYEILGLNLAATRGDVLRAFRRAAMRHHPDVCRDPDATGKFEDIAEAYRVLGSAEERRSYDEYYRRRFFCAARTDVQARVEHHPPHEPADFDSLFRMAVRLEHARDHPQAERMYRSALALRPLDIKVLTGLGCCLANQGRFQEAEEFLRKAARTEPRNFFLARLLAQCLDRLGKADEAEGSFRLAARLAPEDCLANYFCGRHLLRLKRAGDALPFLRRARAADPRRSEIWNTLGVCLEHLGDVVEAKDCFAEALRRDPKNLIARRNLELVLSEFTRKGIGVADFCPSQASVKRTAARMVRIDYHRFEALTFRLLAGDTVHLEVSVLKGAPLDVLFLDHDNFDRFARGDAFSYYVEATELATRRKHTTMMISKDDTYFLVFDNTQSSLGQASDVQANQGIVIVQVLAAFDRSPSDRDALLKRHFLDERFRCKSASPPSARGTVDR